MKHILVSVAIFALALMVPAAGLGQQQRPAPPFTIDDLLKIRRVADPQLSPDSRWITYTITDTDKQANKRTSQIYLMSIDGNDGRQLTTERQSSSSPRWSPDGKRLAFVSARDGEPQVWMLEIESGEVRRVTDIAGGADAPIWSPDGKYIAFTSEIYPECATNECNKQRFEQAAQSKVKAKIATRLLYRHWNAWKEGKRNHVFVVALDSGELRDLTPGDWDAPPFSLGGPIDYAFSPDSKELAFARNTDEGEARSTNSDIFIVPVSGGEPKRITGENPAGDLSPQYSPDGHYLAYRAQQKGGFESDRWRLMLYDRRTGQSHSVTEQFDSSVESFVFSPDSQTIYFTALERGRQPVFEVSASGGAVRKVITDGFNDDLQVSNDGKTLVLTRQSGAKPIEIYSASSIASGIVQLTKVNDEQLAEFGLRANEDVTWEGAGGTRIHGFITKPPSFSPNKKYPVIVLIHGGPQGSWNDAWSYRWNPQLFAAAGYVVFSPNPRGSFGYGQKFVDEISGDWGGKVFVDIMNGAAYVASLPYVDRDHIGAAGGSYGGYMINWIEGHNNDSRVKFKALVSHAGVYNLTSMYGATEELWFPEWEFKGTPWTNPEMYSKWSPHNSVKEFRTPCLVIHGEQDYRVPTGEGLQLFTALQRQGVESKLLIYPDEGHFVLKPQNSELWYHTVLDWFDVHLKSKNSSEGR